MLVQVLEQFLQNREGRSPVELVEDVPLTARNPPKLADGFAALRHDRINDDVAAQRDPYGTRSVDLAVQEEGVQPRRGRAAGETPNLCGPRESVVQTGEQRLQMGAERICEEDELGLLGPLYADEILPEVRRAVEVRQRAAQVERVHCNVRKPGCGEGYGGEPLDLLAA